MDEEGLGFLIVCVYVCVRRIVGKDRPEMEVMAKGEGVACRSEWKTRKTLWRKRGGMFGIGRYGYVFRE